MSLKSETLSAIKHGINARWNFAAEGNFIAFGATYCGLCKLYPGEGANPYQCIDKVYGQECPLSAIGDGCMRPLSTFRRFQRAESDSERSELAYRMIELLNQCRTYVRENFDD